MEVVQVVVEVEVEGVVVAGRQWERITCSRSTSSASFMFFVWIRSTSRRPFSSGTPMSTCAAGRGAGEG